MKTAFEFVRNGLALIGFFCVVAMSSYTYHIDKPIRSARCINSDCESKCSARFVRHAGECK